MLIRERDELQGTAYSRRPLTMLWVAVAVIASFLVWTAASALGAEVSGRVFNDFNTNGVFNTDDNAGAVDVGVAGLTVRAFTGTDTEVGHAVSGADGKYRMSLPNAKVRLELDLKSPWWPSRQLNGLRSDVQFVNASSARTGVDFGVHRLTEFSVDNPILFWATQWAGPPVASNPNASQIAIRGAPYFSKRPFGQVQSWRELPGKIERATFEQIGTVFGVAEDQATNDIYAGAYQKRFAGLKDGPGAIFRITPSRHVSLFANLPAGTDPHPRSTDIEDWINCAGATESSHPRCDFSWTEVGKIGLGSVVIDPENQDLYTVDLHNKSLYRLPLREAHAVAANAGAARAQDPATPIPNPNCPGGADDWRPFAAAFDRVNDQLYVGGVCSAATTQQRSDLRAVVYRVDQPRSASPSFVKVLEFGLNYDRGPSTNPLKYCGAPYYCHWNPWPTVSSTGGKAPSAIKDKAGQTVSEQNNPSFPLLSGITFAEDGSMILGFRDLMGDMGGVNVPGEIGNSEAQGVAGDGLGPMLHGDMLRAGTAPDGHFTLEQKGRVAGLTSKGQSTNPINWKYGAGLGPGGGYFYNPAPLAAGPDANRQNSDLFNIPHPYQGGLTQIPGFADVVATSIHIRNAQENGLLWRDNTTGDTKGALQNYTTPDVHHFTGFAKSNGLGDIGAFTGLAPVQIGNRLWYDTNRNGIQDADENPVPDAIVELLDCHGNVVDSTRTDPQGEYVFNIAPDTCYHVRVPLGQPPLRGWVPTKPDAGNDPRIDSNGHEGDGFTATDVSPHGVGQNDFTYDFGFHKPAPGAPPPPKPPPPPTQPSAPPPTPPRGQPPASPPTQPAGQPAPAPARPTPPSEGVQPAARTLKQPPVPKPPKEPKAAGADVRPLVLVKRLVSSSGRATSYRLLVRDGGASGTDNVRVCDPLPSSLKFMGGSKAGRTVTGRRVCWNVGSLASGEERTLQLKTRLTARRFVRTVVNCATATGTGVPKVRACETVQGRQAAAAPPPPKVTG